MSFSFESSVLINGSIQVSDAMVGMLWSGIVTFVILLCMEAIIVGWRKIFNIKESEFALILDEDIILDHEIADEYLKSHELQLVVRNDGSSDEQGRPGEMPAGNAAAPGLGRREVT